MTFMNSGANIKQFQLIRFVNENCSDDHVITKVSIVLRKDKLEAPYYMTTNIRMSSCIDMPDNGIIHAMDILNHQRMYNLSEEKYNEIKSLITEISDGCECDQVKIFKKEKRLKLVMMSKSDEEISDLFENHHELFDLIDNLID